MDNSVDIHLVDLHRKNALVLKSLFFTFILGLCFQIVFSIGWFVIAFQLVGGFFTLLIGFFHFRKKATNIIPYIAVIGLSIVAFGFMASSDDPINILILYYLIVNVSVYMNRRLMIIGIIVGLAFHIWYLPIMGLAISKDPAGFFIYICYFLTTVVVLYNKQRIANYLVDDITKSKTEAQSLLQLEIEREKKLKETSIKVLSYMKSIQETGDLNKQSMQEMNHSFQEMASGVNQTQVKSVS